MAKSDTKMPNDLFRKCNVIIHTAAVASAAGGAIPLPFADALPIGTAQITMIISLGKVFDLTIGKAAAKSIAEVGLATTGGRFVVSNLLKVVPGPWGPVVGAGTAATITEALGWITADDFYMIKNKKPPEDRLKGIGAYVRHIEKNGKKKKK